MMRQRLALSVTLAFTFATACHAAAERYWLKDWSFGVVQGSAAARAALASTGVRHLTLTEKSVVDPLGEGCSSGVSYEDIRHRNRRELAKHIGAFWRLPATIDAPDSVSGWLRCNGQNLAPVAFITPQLGYRFFEDGVVVILH